MRPFFYSLRFKLLAMILVALAVTGGIFSYLQYSSHKRMYMRDLEASAIRSGNLVISSLEHHMSALDREGIQRAVESIIGGGEVEDLLILNKQGEIRFASKRNQIGIKLDLKDSTCQLCHRNVQAEQRPKAVIFPKETGERVYRLVNPILNKTQCQGCHGPGARLVGVQVADFSLEEIEAHLASETKGIFFYMLFAITTIGLILWVLVDRTVIHKLGRFSVATERITKGDLDARVEVKGEDEVGKLARAFNTMAHQLQASIAQIEEYSHTLEEKVQESRAIMEIQREILEELDLERLLPLIIKRASELLKAQSGTIYLYDEHHKVCRPKAWYNMGEWIRNVEIPLGKGVTGTAALEKRGIIVNDYPNSPYAIPAFLEHPIWAVISQPLIIKDKAIGVITINDANIGRSFTQDDLKLLGLFANHAAISIENARLYEKELKKSQELSGLIKVGQAVSSSLSLEYVLKSVVFLAAQVMNVSTCALMLLDEKGEELVCQAQIGLPDEWVRDEKHRVGIGLSGFVALEGRPLAVLDITSDLRYVHKDLASKYGFASYLGVPVKAKERLIGVLSILTKRPRFFTEDEIGLLSTFADQAAIAIENARLFESEIKLLREAQERRRLEEVSRIRSEFIAHVSHELRTPLNAIIGFSELLQDKTFGELTERQFRYIHNIYESGRHLLSVINDILDISKVEAGKIELHPERFSLPEALDAALRIVQPQARKKSLSLELEVDPSLSVIKADPVRFKQIMYNLLSNAVKFTPDGGSVRVVARLVRSLMSDVRSQEVTQGLSPELRTTAHLVHGSQFTVDGKGEEIREPSTVNRERDFVEISVSDTGIGIKPEDQGKLFKEFVQIDSPYARKYKGTGLGLALTKRLVEMHQGKIWAESGGEGMGSKFTFILPLSSGSDQHINL